METTSPPIMLIHLHIKIFFNFLSEHILYMKKLKVLDLFCGCGGFTQGLKEAELNIICGIDLWDKAIQSYMLNNNHLALKRDLTKFSPEDLQRIYNEQIDIIVGGPPCQSYSVMGKRDKNNPRNSLFKEFVKYIRYYKPKAFIMENVIGILSMKTKNNKKVINIIMKELTKGYKCKYFKITALNYEVPQNRKRVIFIGFRNDLNIEPMEPTKINKIIPLKKVLDKNPDQIYYLSKKQIKKTLDKMKKYEGIKYGFKPIFININKPSLTIMAHRYSNRDLKIIKYTDKKMRYLTINEIKKIQTFDSNYKLIGTPIDKHKQIGNAVPPKLAYHLGLYLKSNLII